MLKKFCSLGLLAVLYATAAVAQQVKPNIVVIMTDDQAVGDMIAMPHTLEQLRDAGVSFANSFVSWPLCCPSRATTFTGQYAHNHRVLGNIPPQGGAWAFTADAETLPVWLQRAGYRTTHIGKYLNGYGADSRGQTYVPPGWSDWKGFVDPQTYQMWGYKINDNGVLNTYGVPTVQDPALYQTDVISGLAVAAIDEAAEGSAPFFLSVAFLAPHEELAETPLPGGKFPGPRPAPRHAGSFATAPLPTPPNFDEVDLSDKPPFVAAFSALYRAETASQRTGRYRRRLEALRSVDEAVLAIVNRLAAHGLLENTYIVFTSDNGWFNGEHRVNLNKYLMYEPSIRVPLLMRGPGIAHGTTQELVANVDLAATFVELAGATPSHELDGRSLMPYARDLTLRSSRPILLDAPLSQTLKGTTTSVTVPAARGLRTQRYTYVEYETGAVELYDLVKDPYQLASAHNRPIYAATKLLLKEALSRYSACVGATCRSDVLVLP